MNIITLLISIFAIGFIIFVHESGHFLVAKLFGTGVVEFSLGLGPRLFSFVKGNTRYSLKAVPFGGSCMMLGEELEEDVPSAASLREAANFSGSAGEVHTDSERIYVDGRTFLKSEQLIRKPAYVRLLIMAAGPVFNFLLAFLLSLVLTGVCGIDRPVLSNIEPGFPAALSGIQDGDCVTEISIGKHSERIALARDLLIFLTMYDKEVQMGEPLTITYRDVSEGGIERSAVLVPVYDGENDRKRMGFSYSLAYEPCKGAGEVIRYSLENVRYCLTSTVDSLKMLLTGRVSRSDVMGPVRMTATINETLTEAGDYGFTAALMTLFDMMILISGSLGAMNLIPFPALDGSRILFALIEIILKKPVPRELESRIHVAGMAVLLVFMVFVLFNDVFLLIGL